GNTNDLEPAAVGIRGVFERSRDLLQCFRVRIAGSGGRLADDPPGSDEAGDVVDVAVGVIVEQAFVDPDDLARAESLPERGFGFIFRPAVAVGVQQGLARRQDRTLAIVIDGTAFEY